MMSTTTLQAKPLSLPAGEWRDFNARTRMLVLDPRSEEPRPCPHLHPDGALANSW